MVTFSRSEPIKRRKLKEIEKTKQPLEINSNGRSAFQLAIQSNDTWLFVFGDRKYR